MGGVTFIPNQTADEAILSGDRSTLQSSVSILLTDIWILIKNLRYVPTTFLPLTYFEEHTAVSHDRTADIKELSINLLIFLVELILLLATPPALLLLPGWESLLYLTAVYAISRILTHPTNGPNMIVTSLPPSKPHFPTEKWVFINGMGTSHRSLQLSCDALSATFQRPITGLHARTHGAIADMLQSLLQHSLNLPTSPTRIAFSLLKPHLLDPGVTKVAVLAHGHGALVLALTLDKLLLHVPWRALGKLELYTFGSGAAWFNNPVTAALSPDPDTNNDETSTRPPTTVIPVIEHYANESDAIARSGVLHGTRTCAGQRYAGRVFVRKNAAGHAFRTAYLGDMFPASSATEARPKLSRFLDQMVDVDLGTAGRRAESVQDIGGMGSAGEGERPLLLRRWTRRTSVRREMEGAVEEGSGRTVRQLSRLWAYVGGGGGKGDVVWAGERWGGEGIWGETRW
ncbi:hypothetical protein M501DRAFT_1028083 [Patellaria atrata CBS 101060]|uniref:Uncharacterized protein n=1 Tax=Patellaria atrata CBS 101060 TaxID=1346257 RepID=A0A9P4SIR8_9PEZI|nr:hypothetical protein M501DRAFT_1028083 [Patellaria atrata CBS 101060]